jgi:hypothetical protein
MKKNWTFAAIAGILAIAAVTFAFIAGKKYSAEPDQDPDQDDDQDDNAKDDKDDKD